MTGDQALNDTDAVAIAQACIEQNGLSVNGMIPRVHQGAAVYVKEIEVVFKPVNLVDTDVADGLRVLMDPLSRRCIGWIDTDGRVPPTGRPDGFERMTSDDPIIAARDYLEGLGFDLEGLEPHIVDPPKIVMVAFSLGPNILGGGFQVYIADTGVVFSWYQTQ